MTKAHQLLLEATEGCIHFVQSPADSRSHIHSMQAEQCLRGRELKGILVRPSRVKVGLLAEKASQLSLTPCNQL